MCLALAGCDMCGGDHAVEACPELGLVEEEETSTTTVQLSRFVLYPYLLIREGT